MVKVIEFVVTAIACIAGGATIGLYGLFLFAM